MIYLDKVYKKYQKLVNEVFSQGDSRYFNTYNEGIMINLFDLNAVDMQKTTLYMIKKGVHWDDTIKKYDQFKLEQLKKVKSPLDSL